MTTSTKKYVCSVCHNFGAPSFDSVLRHIGSVHSCEPNLHLTCGIEGCPRTYTSYRCFRKHLFKSHVAFVDPPSSEQPSTPFEFSDGDIQSLQPSNDTLQVQTTPKHVAALFLLKAKEGHKVSQSALDGLIGDISELLSATVSSVGNAVRECIKDSGIDSVTMTKIDSIFSNYQMPFEGLQSAYMQQKYYAEFFNLVVSCNINFEARSMYMCIITTIGTCGKKTRSAYTPIHQRKCVSR